MPFQIRKRVAAYFGRFTIMTTFEKVQAILAEQLNIDPAKITPDSEIIADLKADSLDVFQLLMSIEDEYQTTVPDDKAQELKKVSDVVAFVDSLEKK